MPKFNAGRFLEANDLQLVGPGESEGQIRVLNSGGQEQTLNISKMLADKGIKADEIVVNDPTNPLNVSPVDLLDRAALSFGNAAGQLAYLKKNYQDAKIVDGDIRVKNKGVWQKMDASGLGDGSGWDMAKEFAKDILDWTGEAPVIAGQIAGAAAGSAAGPVGTVAGAGAGAGVGRGASIVMGRILGTYEGDASEIAKDVVMDTVLSAAGESVALGAKNLVIPKMKAAFSKLSEVADPKVKDTIAGVLRQGAGMSEIGAYTAIKEPEAVFGVIDRVQKKVGAGATADIIQREARQEGVDLMTILAENAQKDISREWRAGTKAAIDAVGDDVAVDISTPLRRTLNDLTANLRIFDIKPVKGAENMAIAKFTPKDPAIIAKELGITSIGDARVISRKMGEFATALNSNLERSLKKPLTGKAAAAEGVELISKFRAFAEEVGAANPDAARNLKPYMAQLQDSIRGQLPEAAQKLLSSTDSMYASNIEYVTAAMRAARTEAGVEGLLAQVKNGGSNSVANLIDSLASRRPGGDSLKSAIHHRIAAMEMVDTTPSGTFGGITRPIVRGAAKAVYPTMKMAAMAGQTLKGLSDSARLELLKNPAAWEAVAGGVMRSLGK